MKKKRISRQKIIEEGIVGITDSGSFIPAHQDEEGSLWNSPHPIKRIIPFREFKRQFPEMADHFLSFPKTWALSSDWNA